MGDDRYKLSIHEQDFSKVNKAGGAMGTASAPRVWGAAFAVSRAEMKYGRVPRDFGNAVKCPLRVARDFRGHLVCVVSSMPDPRDALRALPGRRLRPRSLVA